MANPSIKHTLFSQAGPTPKAANPAGWPAIAIWLCSLWSPFLLGPPDHPQQKRKWDSSYMTDRCANKAARSLFLLPGSSPRGSWKAGSLGTSWLLRCVISASSWQDTIIFIKDYIRHWPSGGDKGQHQHSSGLWYQSGPFRKAVEEIREDRAAEVRPDSTWASIQVLSFTLAGTQKLAGTWHGQPFKDGLGWTWDEFCQSVFF